MSPNKKLRILIADDVQETRRNTRLMVSTIDHLEVVAIASNGQQAIEMTCEHQPDILLMDINMPLVDGLTAIRQILKFAPNTGCIIISAERNPNAFREAMSLGVREYLIKPFTVDELEAAVERVYKRMDESIQVNTQADQLRRKNEEYLKQLGNEYIKSKRTDDQAVAVFEQLVDTPNCEQRWIQTLAIIYVLRKRWDRLKLLIRKIEQDAKNITL